MARVYHVQLLFFPFDGWGGPMQPNTRPCVAAFTCARVCQPVEGRMCAGVPTGVCVSGFVVWDACVLAC